MSVIKGLGIVAAAAAGVAIASAADEPRFSGNIALATDYSFRGHSQTDNGPTVQGGFDYSYGLFYAGTWASNVDFGIRGTSEFDVYAGLRPTLGPVALDLGLIGYFYPGAADDGAELDYQEAYAKASVSPIENLTLGAGAFYSPEFTGDTGQGLYGEINAAYKISDMVSLSGAVGTQKVEDVDFKPKAGQQDRYSTWNLGGTVNAYGFSFDLRYVDTDLADDLKAGEGRAIFAIRRAF
jgi:uncharacterized protein (TIGR02001 family)